MKFSTRFTMLIMRYTVLALALAWFCAVFNSDKNRILIQDVVFNLVCVSEMGINQTAPAASLISCCSCCSAVPIKRCLDLGADIVVTGRCVDSAVVLGPLMHSVRFISELYFND